jgi:hypothetical protein
MLEESKSAAPQARLGMAFHETFRFERVRMRTVLEYARHHGSFTIPQLLDDDECELGTNMKKAFPRWGVGAGLLCVRQDGYTLTQLGSAVVERDPMMSWPESQWLIHYHLSAPHGPGPFAWHRAFSNLCRFGRSVTRRTFEQWMSEAIAELEGKTPRPNTTAQAAGVFLGTYLSHSGLGALGLIEEVEDAAGFNTMRASQTESVPPEVVGYAVVDTWSANWHSQETVSLARLSEADGVSPALCLGENSFSTALDELQRRGYLHLFRVAPPFQAARRWSDPSSMKATLLQEIYR